MGRVVPRLLKSLFKATILVLAVAVLALISRVVYGYMKETPLLTLREVTIEGCQKTSEKDILSMTQLDRHPNVLSINLAKLKSEVEAHPWIERAEIRRIFPDRVSIKIIERQPVAIILLDRLYYIDGQGVIFARVPKGRQIDYPVLTGLDRDDFKAQPDEAWGFVSKALRLVRLIEGGETLSQRDISEIHIDKAFGISLYTNEGAIEIKLGLDHYDVKWERLERVWRHLRKRPLKPAYIDCNYEKRVIVKMRDAMAFYPKRSTKYGLVKSHKSDATGKSSRCKARESLGMRRTYQYAAVTKDEAQRSPSALLKAVSMSNGPSVLLRAMSPSTLLRTVSLSNGLSNGRWAFYEAEDS